MYNYLYLSDYCSLSLQRRTVRKRDSGASGQSGTDKDAEKRERIIRRAALEFKDGMYGILFIPFINNS